MTQMGKVTKLTLARLYIEPPLSVPPGKEEAVRQQEPTGDPVVSDPTPPRGRWPPRGDWTQPKLSPQEPTVLSAQSLATQCEY